VDTETPAERLRIALDMYETGELMQRQRLRPLHPDA
jgi:Rv0078B-related antitoxin